MLESLGGCASRSFDDEKGRAICRGKGGEALGRAPDVRAGPCGYPCRASECGASPVSERPWRRRPRTTLARIAVKRGRRPRWAIR